MHYGEIAHRIYASLYCAHYFLLFVNVHVLCLSYLRVNFLNLHVLTLTLIIIMLLYLLLFPIMFVELCGASLLNFSEVASARWRVLINVFVTSMKFQSTVIM